MMTLHDHAVKANRERLRHLIAEAREHGKWLYASRQGVSFSPDELERENAEGRALWWTSAGWQLRNPADLLRQAQEHLEAAQAAYARLRERIGKAI